MNVKALAIHLGTTRLGVLFQYTLSADTVVNRFVADDALGAGDATPTLSLSLRASSPQAQAAVWRDVLSRSFNGRHSSRGGWLLPAFFQNLLPEGVFRDHVAALRDCSPTDHFEMLAACGKDLPGNVHALPVALSRDELARCVTQGQDALEMSVTADPLDEGVSLSGVQPKLGVVRDGDRYVGRTKDQDTHIIAKLPVVGQPRLPEVEELTLRLARAAGVDACEATLEPLSRLGIAHDYDLGDADASTHFLAVTRFDRSPAGRIHVEDFAQIFSRMPEDKYGAGPDGPAISYVDLALAMMTQPSLGEAAVHELLRRLVVNELVGNPDMHLKNIGVRYLDGVTPTLSPAYDLVAYAVYHRIRGHALRTVPEAMAPDRGEMRHATPAERQALGPQLLRIFCDEAGLTFKPAEQAVMRCVKAAFDHWPAMIDASALTDAQKQRLLSHFMQHRMIQSLARRAERAAARMAGRADQADPAGPVDRADPVDPVGLAGD
ncbi:type II toxin-antitoxin system HipA family toxin [Mitsuaria sp. GD03876]|uniref:type II toxin-antitoxin system HipA family toxin n=1 Tax=Mitsuaria sp. GD03876 TaxID=2975399 RepID=UPI00244CAD59|nr:type II toxin-antitoxin system HipA family toxin [Mitsuaria sp. GD03876]MDH0866100.1 type II toxin-antitoxin system HipA family toxin [Mitsuaria sp. GD03876]